ncbi:MAG: elongation factor G [Clostridiales bacterium]|jgi:elongation factor G|nr:elongation factor G [Clostridiales bacterium]
MGNLKTENIRNVAFLGHGGAGKTSLTESMLFNTGVLDRLGKVVDGNTATDYDADEIKRKISINTALAPCEWKNNKINIIDTPGYFDFVGEMLEGIKVADSAVILLSGRSGVAVGTEKAWDSVCEMGIPRAFYINKMCEENANFSKAYTQIRDMFGESCIAVNLPIFENNKLEGYVDTIKMKGKKYVKNAPSTDIEIPGVLKEEAEEIHNSLCEKIAETSEALMDKFFSGESFTEEEFTAGLKSAINDCSFTPVLMGSAIENFGVRELADFICELMPSPSERGPVKAKNVNDEDIELKIDSTGPVAAFIFKTIADPFVGKLSLFKVYSGCMKSEMVLYNSNNGMDEKISQVFTLRGKKQLQAESICAGDIGAVSKLQNTVTNDTLCLKSNPVKVSPIIFPEPSISLAMEPKSKGDEEKISLGLSKLLEEDPTFRFRQDPETSQMLVSGIGEQHLDIIVTKLKAKYGVTVTLTDPKIPYRETIRKKVRVEGKHKKQSGGHGQYGHVWIEFEPGTQEGLEFEEKVFGGAVPKSYFPAVEKGLQESIKKGVLAGYPVVNLKATLMDGSYHPVDSSEMAFKIAASLAYKKGLAEASPVLLEPIMSVSVYVPDSYMGDIIGDLNKRRGRVLGMNPVGKGIQEVVAEVPQAEMFKYATDLRSMTQGRGSFKSEFARYEEIPSNISAKIIENAKATIGHDEDE